MTESKIAVRRKGEGSFCLPRATVNALLEEQASAHEICAVLTLARATDPSGCYSRASVSAVRRSTGAFKPKILSSLDRLTRIRARHLISPPGDEGSTPMVEDLGPILWTREDWTAHFEGPIPDDQRHPTFYVIPGFGEDKFERVWFSSSLIDGYGEFRTPLAKLRDLGDVAARLLLLIHATTDMENWGAASPLGTPCAPWRHYKLESHLTPTPTIRLSKAHTPSSWRLEGLDPSIDPSSVYADQALRSLIAYGFVYEVVTVINRHMLEVAFDPRTTQTRFELDPDCQPLYDLYAVTRHGRPSDEEVAVGRAIAATAAELDNPISDKRGQFNESYGVVARVGQPISVIGLLRPRFRVRNHLNAGVSDAWNRIRQSNAEALRLVEDVRIANGLDPWKAAGKVVEGSTSQQSTGEIPINTCQSSTNKSQSLQREKRKRKAPAEESGFDLEKELRNAL